jgi:hypothetical protein
MIRLSRHDQLDVRENRGRYQVTLRLAPAMRPTGQTDDIGELLLHAARFSSLGAALDQLQRVKNRGYVDVRYWIWTPREHGRFTEPPVATPYDIFL